MSRSWAKYTPEQKAYLSKKKSKAFKKFWANNPEGREAFGQLIKKYRANLTEEEVAERSKKMSERMKKIHEERGLRKNILVEAERINDYCGIITESQYRELKENGRN